MNYPIIVNVVSPLKHKQQNCVFKKKIMIHFILQIRYFLFISLSGYASAENRLSSSFQYLWNTI